MIDGHQAWLAPVQTVLLSSEPYAFSAQYVDAARALARPAQTQTGQAKRR